MYAYCYPCAAEWGKAGAALGTGQAGCGAEGSLLGLESRFFLGMPQTDKLMYIFHFTQKLLDC